MSQATEGQRPLPTTIQAKREDCDLSLITLNTDKYLTSRVEAQAAVRLDPHALASDDRIFF